MESEATVEIDRPIEEIFDYTTKNVADWSLTVVEDELIEEKSGGGVGTTFRCVTEDRGRRMELAGTITRHEPPTLHESELRGQAFDILVCYTFEDLSGRTRVTQKAIVTPKGFLKVMFFLFGWFARRSGCKAAENELLSLKAKAEARATAAS